MNDSDKSLLEGSGGIAGCVLLLVVVVAIRKMFWISDEHCCTVYCTEFLRNKTLSLWARTVPPPVRMCVILIFFELLFAIAIDYPQPQPTTNNNKHSTKQKRIQDSQKEKKCPSEEMTCHN